MSDPYSILGVDRNATDEDVKKAYRKLSRQYHPDANINNPKKDEAEAKFKEVQQAYQQIMDEREKEYNSGYGSSAGSGYGSYSSRRTVWHRERYIISISARDASRRSVFRKERER